MATQARIDTVSRALTVDNLPITMTADIDSHGSFGLGKAVRGEIRLRGYMVATYRTACGGRALRTLSGSLAHAPAAALAAIEAAAVEMAAELNAASIAAWGW